MRAGSLNSVHFGMELTQPWSCKKFTTSLSLMIPPPSFLSYWILNLLWQIRPLVELFEVGLSPCLVWTGKKRALPSKRGGGDWKLILSGRIPARTRDLRHRCRLSCARLTYAKNKRKVLFEGKRVLDNVITLWTFAASISLLFSVGILKGRWLETNPFQEDPRTNTRSTPPPPPVLPSVVFCIWIRRRLFLGNFCQCGKSHSWRSLGGAIRFQYTGKRISNFDWNMPS